MSLKKFQHVQIEMSATDWLVDLVIFAGAFGFGLLQLTLSANLIIPDDFTRRLLGIRMVSPTIIAVVATFLTCVPLIFRRKFPVLCFALCQSLWLVFEWILSDPILSLIGVLVSLFTLSYEMGRNHTFIACAVALIGVLLIPFTNTSSTLTSLLLLQNMALIVAVCFAGYSLHTSSKLTNAARMQAREEAKLRHSESLRAKEQLRAQRSEAEQRAEAQRVQIAREIHDITAHSLTAVNVQAQAAIRLFDVDHEGAKDALVSIRKTSKDALEETRALLSVLRSGNNSELEPTHNIEDIPTLKDYLESAGIQCEMHIDSDLADILPAYMGIALYGMTREAATNIVRHASASKALISLKFNADTHLITLVVEDDGKGFSYDETNTDKHGLMGISERAKILDGHMETSQSSLGGFKLNVVIPFGEKTVDAND